MGIVVTGAAFVDVKGYPEGIYIPEGRNVGRVEQIHGGVSRNVVEDIANVQLNPVYLGLADTTGLGVDVIRHLKDRGVDTRYMLQTPDGMGTWLAVFDHNGDVVGSISRRPDLSPIHGILDQYGDEIFSQCDSVALELDMDRDLTDRIYAFCAKYRKKIYAVVSNMSIAVKRRDLLRSTACLVCNQQEAGILFMEDYDHLEPKDMQTKLAEKIVEAGIPQMVVTMGGHGAVYASLEDGVSGFCPARKVEVRDTTGAGDAFFAGVTMGLTYGKSLAQACEIGTRLAASVITTAQNVCPSFLPGEFGLNKF